MSVFQTPHEQPARVEVLGPAPCPGPTATGEDKLTLRTFPAYPVILLHSVSDKGILSSQ